MIGGELESQTTVVQWNAWLERVYAPKPKGFKIAEIVWISPNVFQARNKSGDLLLMGGRSFYDALNLAQKP